MNLTKHEKIALLEAIRHEKQAHKADFAVALITKNRPMVEFHNAKIELLESIETKTEDNAP